MQKVINGTKYDTDSAELVAQHMSRKLYSDNDCASESLYRTEKGNWFILADASSELKYGNRDCKVVGEKKWLVPFTEEKAQRWLERNDQFEQLNKWFSDSIENA
jgi:hypothetical protein